MRDKAEGHDQKISEKENYLNISGNDAGREKSPTGRRMEKVPPLDLPRNQLELLFFVLFFKLF